ncbi:MAG: sulfotransferase [Chromatiales bacterium]|nr:sulfotransferase [Chromatiales bacterium]
MKTLGRALERRWYRWGKPALQSLKRPGQHPGLHVFVAGSQRSGTNMVMELLELSTQTDVYHEHDGRAFDNYHMRDEATIRRLVDASRAEVFIIKALLEADRMRDFLDAYPPSKGLWIVRRVDDMVNSMLISFRNMANQARRILTGTDEWFADGMSEHTRTVVEQLVKDDISDASASALQWYYRNALYFDKGMDKDERILLVPYERLIFHPDQEFRRICEFLGIDYSPRFIKGIRSSSFRKRPPPEIDPDIRATCEQMWGRFRELDPKFPEMS